MIFNSSSPSTHHSDLDSSITHLQNALQQISSCVTANLLTLNSSKTEVLLLIIIIIIIIINEEVIVAFSPKTTRTRYKVKKQNREIRRV